MLAKPAPWPTLAWPESDGYASLWIVLPVASVLALNWSYAATRLPRLALILSLILHLIVLAILPNPARKDRPSDPGPLQATLRLAPPHAQPPNRLATPARIPEARRLPPRPIALNAKAETGAAVPLPSPIPANTASAPAARHEFPSAARREEAATAPASPSPPWTTQPVSPVDDSLALEDYGRSLLEMLAHRQQYPRLAALRGWEGEVRLCLRVAGKGGLLTVQVVRSSGFELLDRHALELVQGVTLPAPPGSFSNREIQVVIPIQYKLQKPI